MKLGIGAIPHNLIIKSGGFTYYPLNQFEIDGTVAIELYRQDSDGDKKKIFIFKGEKDELKKFKAKFPVIKEMRSYNEYGSGSSRKTKMVSTNTSDSYLLYKLAENLSAEAAAFNKKIKKGARLTPNEQIAVKKSGTTMIAVLRKLDENKIIDQKYPKSNAFTRRKPIAVKKTKLPAVKSPAAKKVDFKITSYSGYFYVIHKNTGLRLINKSFRSYDDAMDSAKKLSFIATDGKPILYDTPIITKSPVVKKPAVKKPAAVKKTITKKNPLRQTGSSNKKYDERVSAMKPGKRTSASGGVYYERRADHSDKGKNL